MPRLDHRPRDEYMSVPTWRVRQLQLIEDAARESVELIAQASPAERSGLVCEVRDLLSDALERPGPP